MLHQIRTTRSNETCCCSTGIMGCDHASVRRDLFDQTDRALRVRLKGIVCVIWPDPIRHACKVQRHAAIRRVKMFDDFAESAAVKGPSVQKQNGLAFTAFQQIRQL